jgi:DNA-binding transcriptional MerR regulator
MLQAEIMSTRQVARKCNCALVTIRMWAKDNGVGFVGDNRRKSYLWTESDVERFLQRENRRTTRGLKES